MRIRTSLLTALLLVGLGPIVAFTYYTYRHAVDREFADVRERHLVIARSLAGELSRYERDVRATVDTVASLLERGNETGAETLLQALDINFVLVADATTGNVRTSAVAAGERGNRQPGMPVEGTQLAELLTLARGARDGAPFAFTTVRRHPNGGVGLHLYARRGERLVIACIGTDPFATLAKMVSFGERGHATIVDRAGNILAHPLAGWVREASNIAAVPAVERVMRGETGVARFHSAAFDADMMAGLAPVDGPGWGVMVPQPVSELNERALAATAPLAAGVVVASLAVVFLVWLSLRWLARPLEKMTLELDRQRRAAMPAQLAPTAVSTHIRELRGIADAHNALAGIVQRSKEELTTKAMQDAVTGIGNRTYFTERGQNQIDRRTAQGSHGLLMLFDLDSFKEINDTRGHAVGDEVLRSFAEQLYPIVKRFMDTEFRGVAGMPPVIGRLGGDEFALLLPLPDDRDDVEAIATALREALPHRTTAEGCEIACRTSAGAAAYPRHGTTVEQLVRRADVALYAAKAQGGGRCTLYAAQSALGSKSEIMAAVSRAIAADELVLEYQPKIGLDVAGVAGVEALLRWRHPQLGRLTPNLFLPAIQQTRIMVELGGWVVRRAIADMQALERHGHTLDVAVNIGVEHFTAPHFTQGIEAACRDAAFDPARLQIEITEDVMDLAPQSFQDAVGDLHRQGVTIAVDDFGKGFSNLSRMAAIPADVIKLDRSLVSGAADDGRMRAVMASAISMSHALGSRVVVEGVETIEDVAVSREAGADALQGFYFAPSLPRDELADWLDGQSRSPARERIAELREALAAPAA